MEEQNNKQPQIPEPAKTPKRVVRTYQEDLAKMSKQMHVPLEANEKKQTQAPKPETPKEEPIKVPTPPQKTLRDTVELEKAPMSSEVKKHYVEEIKTTDSIDITNTKSFSEEDIDTIVNTLPTQTPKPVQRKEIPQKQPAIIREESSAPKQGIFSSIMSWLLGGTGTSTQKEKAPKKVSTTYTPPKKLESVPIVPNVPVEKPPVPEVIKEEVPEPPQAPKKPELTSPPAAPHIVLKQPEIPTQSRNPLFAPPQEVKKEVPQASLPPKPKTEFKAPSPISTYTSDARKGIRERNETSLSVLAKQQDAKKVEPKSQNQKKKTTTPILAFGIVFLVLGISVIAGTFYFLNQDTAPVATPTRVVTPVFAENRVRVSASGTPTLSNLSDLLSSVPTPEANTLSHVTFSTPSETGSLVIPFSDILLQTQSVPGTLARSVYPQSMLGVYGETQEVVMVLAVTSFERSFKSLLSWESEMAGALTPLFGELYTTQVGTSTPPYTARFIDEEVETTDVRVLYDAAGNTHIIYGFVTPNILFITKTKDTFIDLTDRIVRE